jgi:hypothetical protein
MDNIHDHNQIKDAPEARAALQKMLLKYMKDELPPEAQAGVAQFIDLMIKIANNEFVCRECLEKHRMTGMQGFIL